MKIVSLRTLIGHRWAYIPFVVTVLLSSLVIIAFVSLWYQAKISTNVVITEHIEVLAGIFKKIEDQCGIISFAHEHTYVDFLTVNSFEGSEVGAMNLAHPEKWKGAYLKDSLSVQGIIYEIVQTKKGYYIVPGTGVALSQGVIGTDMVFTMDTDIDAMIKPGGVLNFHGKPLAAKIEISGPVNERAITSEPLEAE